MNKKKNSSTTGKPWSIKGIRPETREAVRKAVRSSGQTIGKWSDRVLHQAAVEALTDKPPALRIEDTLEQISKRLSDIEKTQHKSFWKWLIGR